ncbi:ribulose-phosphate 3-epimerase [Gemmiger sp.]|uniref:ribulose-phosphate 3-epimerase n=1 Tax=Gemmiger sp. TaxID=2049027 RepID=UPI003F0017EE
MTELSVSILSADLADLGAECRRAMACGATMVHYDVMDGHFVPNITYGAPVLKCLKKAVPEMVYDVHLMISEPARYAPDFASAGADFITFHYEAVPGAVEQTIVSIRETGCRVGMSINPSTSPQAIFPYLDKLDLVLVMGVNPGFGGQTFIPSTVRRVAEVKAECDRRGLSPYIQVDGGVNAVTGPRCAAAGANLLVMGSAFFGAQDPAALAKTIREL